MTERLRTLARGRSADSEGAPPPCVGCRGELDGLEPVEVDAIEPSTGDSVIWPVDGVQMAAVEDSLVVLDPVSGQRVLLNATAALIFTAVDARTRVDDLVERIAGEVGVAVETVESDVIRVVDQLICRGVLTRDDVSDRGRWSGVTPSDGASVPGLDRTGVPSATGDADITWAYDSGPLAVAGTTIVVRVEPARIAAQIEASFAAFPAAPPSGVDVVTGAHRIEVTAAEGSDAPGAGAVEVRVDGVEHVRWASPESVVAVVFDQLDRLLAERAAGLRFHAGAVEVDGRVVLVLGRSGAGKSSLTAALVQRGGAYLTDELVALRSDTLRVDSYPRPLDLDGVSRRALGLGDADLDVARPKGKVIAATLGGVSRGGRVALVVLVTGARGPDAVTVTRVRPAEAVMALIGLTFAPSFDDPRGLDVLAELCTTVPVVEVTRGPLDVMAGVVERRAAG